MESNLGAIKHIPFYWMIYFSSVTLIQIQTLKRYDKKLRTLANKSFLSRAPEEKILVEGKFMSEWYDLCWFWILGTYEVLRTMDDFETYQRKQLSPDLRNKIKLLKREISKIRVPMAKQEMAESLAGRKKMPDTENSSSVASFNVTLKDFGFKIEGRLWYRNDFSNRFFELITTLGKHISKG